MEAKAKLIVGFYDGISDWIQDVPSGSLLVFMLVFIEFTIEGSSSDIEYFRGFLSVARRELKGFLDGPSLDRVHRLPYQFVGTFRRFPTAEPM